MMVTFTFVASKELLQKGQFRASCGVNWETEIRQQATSKVGWSQVKFDLPVGKPSETNIIKCAKRLNTQDCKDKVLTDYGFLLLLLSF